MRFLVARSFSTCRVLVCYDTDEIIFWSVANARFNLSKVRRNQ